MKTTRHDRAADTAETYPTGTPRLPDARRSLSMPRPPGSRVLDSHRLDAVAELKKLRQVGEGVPRLRTMYLATVAWLISMPSLSSSP